MGAPSSLSQALRRLHGSLCSDSADERTDCSWRDPNNMGDLNVIQARFIALQTSIIIDGCCEARDSLSKTLQELSARIASEGLSFIEVTLPRLGRALDQGLVSGIFVSPMNFRTAHLSKLPRLYLPLFRKIFDEGGKLLYNADIGAIRCLRQLLLLQSKVEVPCDPKVATEFIARYREGQRNLRKVKLDTSHPVVKRAQGLIRDMFRGFDLRAIVPGHGPGAVYEKLNRAERWDMRSWPSRAQRVYPYHEYAVHGFGGIPLGFKMVRESTTRCCLVPKDFRGPRLISIESTATQYLQQGQMRSLMRYIRNHPVLSLSLHLEDQSFNQRHAQAAYGDGDVTLDLSNASDTVSVPLVWYLFAGVPHLRRQLFASRSQYIAFESGEKERLISFSPMGSATCFPIESIVFWALAMASLDLCSRSQMGARTLSDRALARSITVFGDDIIVPDRCSEVLIGSLLSVGCVPNMSKTCRETPFRESCGSDWFHSIDVSIIRNKRWRIGTLTIGDHPVLCDLQRRFFLRGYHATAAVLAEWVNSILPTPITNVAHLLGLPTGRTREVVEALSALTFFERQAVSDSAYAGLLDWYTDCVPKVRVRNWTRYCRLPLERQSQEEWCVDGWPRLQARLTGDDADRIAIRTSLEVKMAWTKVV